MRCIYAVDGKKKKSKKLWGCTVEVGRGCAKRMEKNLTTDIETATRPPLPFRRNVLNVSCSPGGLLGVCPLDSIRTEDILVSGTIIYGAPTCVFVDTCKRIVDKRLCVFARIDSALL